MESETHIVKIPRILFLALSVASFYKKAYYNTSDLVELTNKYKHDIVRSRVNKRDYKYLDDTKFGGLRGNFSTLLTWKGFVKKGSLIVNTSSVGKDGRLVNAICNGDIILDPTDESAHTKNEKLAKLLEAESWLRKVREDQAHIKLMLERSPEIPLQRDNDNFPKDSVVKSENHKYFIRALVNNFTSNGVLEYNLTNLWEGKKLKKKNLHLLLVLPDQDNSWAKIFAIKIEDLLESTPLLLDIDLKTKTCTDKIGKQYRLYELAEAIRDFSAGDSNIKERLSYRWKDLKEQYIVAETSAKTPKESEFHVFLNDFLNWKKGFEVDGKIVVDIHESGSGGPDVTLTYSGGTTQKVELEHKWKNYLLHHHNEDNAWRGVWLFAREEWNPSLILQLFGNLKDTDNERIPDVFLCIENGERKIYKANWPEKVFAELSFKS